MAKSLKGLIEFLLEEISLRGDQGVAASDVLGLVDHYYSPSQNGQREVSHGGPANDVTRVHNVDERFKSHVWRWLAKHPEVSIGMNKEANNLSLAEVVAHSKGNDNESNSGNSRQNEELRVFVSLERMWLAITGHGPDSTRVLPLEFALLSIIASRKGKGVVQPDLVQLSGQDKRSVPQRTVSLQQKGYIEKKAIQYKSARTSLCTLTKFSGSNTDKLSYVHSSPDGTTPELNKYKIIDFSVLLTKLFTVLKEYQVISRDDLKKKMEMQDRWHGKILRRAIQKLEAIGCVRRVRAMSQYHKIMKTLHASVMLIREPTAKDVRMFHEDTSSLISSLESGGVEDEELAQDEPAGGTPEIDPLLQDGSGKAEFVVDASRKCPQWNPDRTLPNAIFDAVDRAGSNGASNQDITDEIMGAFFRRPLEATLSRLTEHWQFSQPLHLRHLAIVRDSALRGTVYHYVQYSFENFASLVNDGQCAWEAVESRPIPGKNAPKALAVDAKPTLDKYGFPISDEPSGLLRKGSATLRQCLEAVKPWIHTPPMRGLVVVKRDNGSYGLDIVPTQRGTIASYLSDRPPKRKYDTTGSPQPQPAPHLLGQEQPLSAFKRRILTKLNNDPHTRPSEKERLEALGLDKTWTEYNVLLIERPTPGVYITPKGKRRPVKKRQGRPGKSRIAIFKLPKLKELDWFTEGGLEPPVVEPSEEVESAAVQEPEGSPSTTQRTRPIRAVTRGRVYRSPTPDSQIEEREEKEDSEAEQGDDFGIEELPKASITKGKRKRRQSSRSGTVGLSPARLEQEQEVQEPKRQKFSERKGATPDITQGRPVEFAKNSTPQEAQTSGDAGVETPVSSPVLQSQMKRSTQQTVEEVCTQSQSPNDISQELGVREQAETIPEGVGSTAPNILSDNKPEVGGVEALAQTVDGDLQIQNRPKVTAKEKTPGVLRDSRAVEPSSNASWPVVRHRKKPVKREMRGGSIAFLRKKILLELIDEAGGVYPMGTELWYPFTTAWLKTKQTERPDMRTIRNTAKSLIEAGKLRQLTFSGRNSKGVIVTKSILAHPDVEPDDTAAMDLQRAILKSDPQLYLPPGVDIDPALRKSNRGLAGHSTKLPLIDGEVKVMLHRPPVQTIPKSERRRVSRPTGGAESLLDSSLDRHVHRLTTIRRSAQGRSYLASSSFAQGGSFSKFRAYLPPMVSKQSLLRMRSKMNAAASLLMSPSQAFHVLSGTFGTGVSLIGRPPRVSFKSKSQYAQYTGPTSLEDIVSFLRYREVAASESQGPDWEQFFRDVDLVKEWECQNPSVLDIDDGDHHFINHIIEGSFNSVELEGEIQFVTDEEVPSSGMRLLRRIRGAPVNEKSSAPHRLLYHPSSNQDRGLSDTRTPRRLTQLQGAKSEASSKSKPEGAQRRARSVTTLPASTERRLMTAVVVMRALAGGLEGRMVDWNLLAPMFPDYSLKLIHDRGRALVAKHRLQLAKMQSDFQERFIEAYKKDRVPPIDYNNLEAYDWEGVVDWAEKNLERPSVDRQLSLPATRKQFDSLFEIRRVPLHNIDEIYHHNAAITIPRKRVLYSNAIFASPISQAPVASSNKPPYAQSLEVVKTWVRANVATPEGAYRGAEARQTLQRFAEDLINEAVQSLVTERIISQGNKGRLIPGRNFDLTEQFLMTLTRKRAVESTHLKRAAEFKITILDPALKLDGTFNVQGSAEDGDMIALINLAAHGRITIVPKNPPQNKYGLTDGGYLTRMMDKGKLRFEVEVRPVPDRYCYGNPIEQSVKQAAIPRGELNESINPITAFVLPKIPLWLDIHAQFVEILWDLIVAAILGILAARPGLGMKDVKRMLEPCLAEWEVKLVLGWMVDAGVLKSIGDAPGDFGSCLLEEWWWMVLHKEKEPDHACGPEPDDLSEHAMAEPSDDDDLLVD